MAEKSLSLTHLTRPPVAAPGPGTEGPFPAMLALHGRGSNERDTLGIAEFLPGQLFWICPRGPLLLGMNSYEWYRVRTVGRPEAAHLFSALETIDRFLDEILQEYPLDPRRVFLLGFSQGSILSMSYALTRPGRVAGVIAQSGYIPGQSGLEVNETEVKGKPFILTHGVRDSMIPLEWARASRALLQKLGVQLEYHEFPMGHGVSPESLSVISAWIGKQLG